MGEVYRARDTRLGRDVALKVLPDLFAADRDRLHRFEQEARTVAALNHPNIVALFDTGEQDGAPYLVSELLEGETLRDKLRAGPLPSRRAVEYGSQIAEGLAAAHDKGIIHRDLKPENVFITKDGRVKILDFGLAKLARSEAQQAASAAGFTSAGATQTSPGIIVGTAAYMSPEQVRGAEVDGRSDIFNLGAILYEMLCGRRAFHGQTPVETMNAILNEDPPELDSAGSRVSPGLERIVRRCLEKSPEQRFQSAKDVAFALEALSGSSHVSAAQTALAARPSRRWIAAVLAVAVIVGTSVAAYLAGVRRGSRPARFERLTFQRGYIRGARFTADGQNVIYSAAWDGRPYEVFTARIGDRHARSLGLSNAMLVGLSAAGDLAVLTNVRQSPLTYWMQVGTLSRAPAGGGAARDILEDVWDADISRDGKDFAVVRAPAGQQQLEYPIGKVLFKTTGYISHPRISADGRQVAFLEHPVWGDDRGYVAVAAANGETKRLTNEAEAIEGLAWSPDGREIWYAATDPRFSQEFVIQAVAPGARPRMIFHVPGDDVIWDTAPEGRILFSHENISSANLVASPSNSPERNISILGYGTSGVISADGKAMAFTEAGHGAPSDYAVYFRRLDSLAAVELGEGMVLGMTPDSKYVVAEVPSQLTKLRILPTGAGEARMIDLSPIHVDRWFVSWLPGGKEFVFQGHDAAGVSRGYRMSLDGGPARPLTTNNAAQRWNLVSPDGKFVVQSLAPTESQNGENVIVDLATGKSRPAPLLEDERPAGWHEDGRHVFVIHKTGEGAAISRVDVFSGQREVWKQIRPSDPAGILTLTRFYVTPSGNAYSYSAGRVLSDLYVYAPNE